jgi:threonine dehydratase
VDFDESKEEAGRLAKAHNLLVVPPFHRELVRGVATYALELLRTVADLKTVYVPIGMGSGVCGLITTRDLLGLETEIVGVVSERAPAYKLSWSARRVVETDSARTFADGVACRVPAAQALEIMLSGAARIVSVSEDETAQAMRFLYSDTHNVAEGAGAVPLAALLKEQREGLHSPQDHVAVVLTGGNVDSDVFAQVLSGETPDVR